MGETVCEHASTVGEGTSHTSAGKSREIKKAAEEYVKYRTEDLC